MTIPVPPVPTTPIVDQAGGLTREGRDFLQALVVRTGGVGTVTIAATEIIGAAENELIKLQADGNLTNSGIVSESGGISVPGVVTYNGVFRRQVTDLSFSELAAGSKSVFAVTAGEEWQVTEIMLSGDGTNFAGGDRDLELKQTAHFTVVPAAVLQALAPGRWGSTEVPYPAIAADMLASVTSDIIADYDSGTSDYTSGQCTIAVTAERVV